MARPLTYRRHGRHSRYDRIERRIRNQLVPGLKQDTRRFVDQEQVRLDTSEGAEGIFDAMMLVQDEDESFTFEEVQQAGDPTDLGLTPAVPPFSAQTMSLDFDGVGEAMKATGSPTLGIADVWSIGMWLKPSDVVGTHILFEFGDGFPGQASRIIPLVVGGNDLVIFWTNSGNTRQNSMSFLNFMVLDTWTHLYFSWDAAGSGPLSVFKDGSPIAPNVTDLSGPIVMADNGRAVTVGNATTPSISWEGPISQLSVWRTIQDAAISDLYSGGNPNSLDLNSGFGGYAGAGDLAHWWRLGHEASPNLGKDYATAGFTSTIDIEASAIGITDADRVADVP